MSSLFPFYLLELDLENYFSTLGTSKGLHFPRKRVESLSKICPELLSSVFYNIFLCESKNQIHHRREWISFSRQRDFHSWRHENFINAESIPNSKCSSCGHNSYNCLRCQQSLPNTPLSVQHEYGLVTHWLRT